MKEYFKKVDNIIVDDLIMALDKVIKVCFLRVNVVISIGTT